MDIKQPTANNTISVWQLAQFSLSWLWSGWLVVGLCCGEGGELFVFAMEWVVSCLSLLWSGW